MGTVPQVTLQRSGVVRLGTAPPRPDCGLIPRGGKISAAEWNQPSDTTRLWFRVAPRVLRGHQKNALNKPVLGFWRDDLPLHPNVQFCAAAEQLDVDVSKIILLQSLRVCLSHKHL